MREKILLFLSNNKDKYFTAMELSHILSGKPDQISSLLKKLYNIDLVERIEDFGPRGGFGYKIK